MSPEAKKDLYIDEWKRKNPDYKGQELELFNIDLDTVDKLSGRTNLGKEETNEFGWSIKLFSRFRISF